MKILGPPTVAYATVERNLGTLKAHPRFLTDMFPNLWDAAATYAIDPIVMVAQSYKESAAGNFTGAVKAEFCNPCGLKNRQSLYPKTDDYDRPLAHYRFSNWRVGCLAHAQHLRAYTGAIFPDSELIFSPRYPLVVGRHKITDVEQLGGVGSWAPSLTYGKEIVAIAQRLSG